MGTILKFFDFQIWPSSVLSASWATKMQSILFESPDLGAIDFCLVKSVPVLLRHSMSGQNYPIYLVLMY